MQMLEELLTRINELGGQDAYPVVARIVFAGNDDHGSFAPNLDHHPGIEKIHTVVRSLEERPDVSAVVVQIEQALAVGVFPAAEASNWRAAR
jgi:hypothetical protein